MKRILVSVLVFDKGKSGIADYITAICGEISKTCNVELLIHPSDVAIFPVQNERITYKFVAEFLKKPLLSVLWHLYVLPLIINFNEYDVVLLPAGNRRLLARFPQNAVVTFHDLAQFYVPEKYGKLKKFYINSIIPYYLRKAPVIMAISENTKNDLIRYFNLPLNQIQVNYNGYNPDIAKTKITEAELRQTYKLERPYFFYNSRIEHPVKNHLHLIRAFELLPEEIRDSNDLVFAGVEGKGSNIVFNYVKGSPVKSNIKFLGYVDSNSMGAFYKYAELYLFPSLYEGFGIPLLEAMACGTPVLCSNSSALPEIGGDAVLTFDPTMHADMAAKILMVLKDPDLRQMMIGRGLERVKNFSWSEHAEKLIGFADNKKSRQNRQEKK